MRLHGIVGLAYLALAVIILNPIITFTGTHVAGFDYFNYHWNLWWIRHTLTTPDLTVYLNDFVFYPAQNNFGYHALSAVWFPLWALLEPLTGTLTAMTMIVMIACWLNGYLLFVWLRHNGVAPGLAFIGGAALQVTPLIRYFYYNTHINLMVWFWLPAHLLLWQQMVKAARNRQTGRAILWAVVQGVGLWGVLLSDLQFPIFVAFLLGPYALYTLLTTTARARLLAAGVLTNIVAVGLAWFAGPLPYILAFEGRLAPSPVDDRPGIPFPRGYFAVDEVWWHWNVPTLGGFVTVVVLLALLVSLSPLRRHLRPIRWLWFALLLPPLILSMGPTITLFGTTIPMPFRALFALTNGMFGMPWRLAPIYLIAGLTFAGLTFTPLLRQWSPGRRLVTLTTALLLLVLSLRIFQFGPLDPVLYPYSFYETMGAETGPPYDDYVVIEVPTGVGTGEILVGDPLAISYQFYGITHGKRMVNGFISRAPVEDFWYIRADDPLLSWLGQRRLLDAATVEAELRAIIPEWPVGYIVVHQDAVGRDTVANQEIIGFFNSLPDLLCPLWVEHDAVVYRTSWHPDGCPPRTPPEVEPGVYQIDIGAPGDEHFTGWGWHWQEDIAGLSVRWAGRWEQADLYVDLPPDDYTLTIMTQAFHEARRLIVTVNGEPVGSAVVEADRLQPVTVAVPANRIGDGQHINIGLLYDGMTSPAAVGVGDSERQLALLVDWVRFARDGVPES